MARKKRQKEKSEEPMKRAVHWGPHICRRFNEMVCLCGCCGALLLDCLPLPVLNTPHTATTQRHVFHTQIHQAVCHMSHRPPGAQSPCLAPPTGMQHMCTLYFRTLLHPPRTEVGANTAKRNETGKARRGACAALCVSRHFYPSFPPVVSFNTVLTPGVGMPPQSRVHTAAAHVHVDIHWWGQREA